MSHLVLWIAGAVSVAPALLLFHRARRRPARRNRADLPPNVIDPMSLL
jgi:hypothetical protein